MNSVSDDIEILELKPKLSDKIEKHQFDENRIMIHQTEFGHRVLLGNHAEQIMEFVNGHRTVKEIADEFNKKYGGTILGRDVYEMLYKKLAKYGIIESLSKIKKADNARYLSIRLILFNSNQVKKVSHLLGSLFEPTKFYFSLLILVAFIGLTIGINFNFHDFKNSFSKELVTLCFIINIISLFLHELGHASACRKFGAEHGGIGFGFYFLTPVLFADVSDAWKLRASQRIIIDLAGFYMQAIINSLIVILYIVTGDSNWMHVAFIFIIGMIMNLNPFFRRDGYWALCDALNIPNLKRKSNEVITSTVKWIFKRDVFPLKSRYRVLLGLYGVLDWAFIFTVLFTIFFHNASSIIYFPYNIFNFFRQLITAYPHIEFIWIKESLFQLLLPFVFYIMLFNLFVKRLFAYLKEKKYATA